MATDTVSFLQVASTEALVKELGSRFEAFIFGGHKTKDTSLGDTDISDIIAVYAGGSAFTIAGVAQFLHNIVSDKLDEVQPLN